MVRLAREQLSVAMEFLFAMVLIVLGAFLLCDFYGGADGIPSEKLVTSLHRILLLGFHFLLYVIDHWDFSKDLCMLFFNVQHQKGSLHQCYKRSGRK